LEGRCLSVRAQQAEDITTDEDPLVSVVSEEACASVSLIFVCVCA